jgi:hypothetical protein
MADNLQLHDGLQEVALLAWVFLLRVQSEALPLEAGTAEEAKSAALGNGRQSAVWVNLLENTIHLRLARRKNRPNGSWLTRKCTCKESGLTLCCVHRMATYLAGKPAGSRLFPLTPPRFLATIQRMLELLEFRWAANLTLKGFRAGRATDMAQAWERFFVLANGVRQLSCATSTKILWTWAMPLMKYMGQTMSECVDGAGLAKGVCA